MTLKELGARARVHPSTVSRVANNDPSLRIAPLTRQRIEALLRETEYRPNGVARGLKLRQTLVLAVVIPDITNPFFAALFRGVEDGASPQGYNVLLCNTDGSPERQRSHLQSLHARQVDGVILASTFLKDPAVRWLRQQHVPYVLVNRYSDEAHDPFVGSDDVMGGRIATAHLAGLFVVWSPLSAPIGSVVVDQALQPGQRALKTFPALHKNLARHFARLDG